MAIYIYIKNYVDTEIDKYMKMGRSGQALLRCWPTSNAINQEDNYAQFGVLLFDNPFHGEVFEREREMNAQKSDVLSVGHCS